MMLNLQTFIKMEIYIVMIKDNDIISGYFGYVQYLFFVKSETISFDMNVYPLFFRKRGK